MKDAGAIEKGLIEKGLFEPRPHHQPQHHRRGKKTLTLSRLMKLCNRSGLRTLMAVRILSHPVDVESESDPPLVYERDRSQKNTMRRPYRIYLRSDRRG